MSEALCERGTAETFKAVVHLMLFGLAVACLGYNAMAACQRKQMHLWRNAIIYAALAAHEAVQTLHHQEGR